LFGLRVRTPRLEVRLPRDEDLPDLLDVVDAGIHDPGTMPFLHPWTDAEPSERARSSLQWWWGARARWSPEDWHFTGAVFLDGRPVGMQDLLAKSFSRLRVVETGSWLGSAFQGLGLGKEMRAAVLHLAFAGLDAMEAQSGAWQDNAASMGVSRSLGYREQVGPLQLRRGQPDRHIDFFLDRPTWQARHRGDITIEGLGPCRAMFGAEE